MHEKAINLGKQIIAQLGRQPNLDVLSRWMAHYIAEQIVIAETAVGSAKKAAEVNCFRTILLLWKHRAFLPNDRRPFEEFESVFRALASLDPKSDQPYLFHMNSNAIKKAAAKESKSVQQLIDFIFIIDDAARILIDATLAEITKKSLNNRTKALFDSARQVKSTTDVVAIGILLDKLAGENGSKQKVFEERLKKLEAFLEGSKIFEKLLRKQVKSAAEA